LFRVPCSIPQAGKYQPQWWAVPMVDALPFGGKMNGSHGGVDGIIYFKTVRKWTPR
jgi:site-specific DNA-methyltransferase (adenine-specific)